MVETNKQKKNKKSTNRETSERERERVLTYFFCGQLGMNRGEGWK